MTVYATAQDLFRLALPGRALDRFEVGEVTQTGPGPALTVSGAPTAAAEIVVEVVGGLVGAGASVRHSLDGGSTWLNTESTQGTLAIVGLTLTFAEIANLLAGTRYALTVADTIAPALEAASATADGYLGARFRLPLLSWSDDLRRAVCQIAAYDLMSRRGYAPEAEGNSTIRERSQDATRWLERVAGGHITPVVTETSPAATLSARVLSSPKRGW